MSRLPGPPMPPIDLPAAYTGPPRVYTCAECAAPVAHTSRIVSTAFRGHAGKGVLLTETRNIVLDPPSILLMDSGAYTIQEFICKACEAYLGWRFLRAHDGSERWKEGHFILELDLVHEHESSPDAVMNGHSPVYTSPTSAAQAQTGTYASPEDMAPHKRAMSADAKSVQGVRQGRRSLQVVPKQVRGLRNLEEEDFDGGPFWKPR